MADSSGESRSPRGAVSSDFPSARPQVSSLLAWLLSGVRELALYAVDPEGRVLAWNPGAERLFGFSADEMIGQDLSRIYLPNQAAAGVPMAELEDAKAHGFLHLENWRVRKDGTRLWVDVITEPIYDEKKQLRAFVRITQDATARRRSEEELRLIIDRVRDYAIFRLDPEGRVSSWNAGAELINGYSADEIVGQHFSVFYPPEDVEAQKPQMELERAMRTGRYEEEGWRIRKNGERYWASVLITALYDEEHQLRGFAKVTRDLTARRNADEVREHLRSEQIRRNAAEQARSIAESAFEQVERLQALSGAFSEAFTREQVAEVAVQQAMGVLRAYRASVFVPSTVESTLRPLAIRGYEETARLKLQAVPVDSELPVAIAFREGRPRYFEKGEELRLSVERHWGPDSSEAGVALPLIVRGRPIGAIGIGFDHPRRFDENTQLFLKAYATTVAQALDRANVYGDLERERQQLAAVLQQMPSAVAIVDAATGKTVLANKQNEVIFRMRSREAAEQGITAYGAFHGLHEDGRPYAPEDWALSRSLQRGEVVRGEEVHIVRADGEHGYIRINSAPVRDDSGRIIAGVVTYDDITEQRRAEAGIRFLADASKVLGSSLDFSTTLQTVAQLAVPTLADWCGVDMLKDDGSIEQLAVAHVDPSKVELAHRVRKLYPPQPNNVTERVIKTGEPFVLETVTDEMVRAGARTDEEYRLLRDLGLRSALVVPITTRRGTVGALSFVSAETGRRYSNADIPLFQEIAKRAALAIENAVLYSEAQVAIQKRDDFLSVASHELKTPLTSLDLNVANLLRLLDPARSPTIDREKLVTRLRTIDRQSERLRELVEDLLDVSRISAGKLVLQPEVMDLGALVQEVLNRFQDQAERAGCALELRAEPGVTGNWDRARIDQVVTNLISNAVKYGAGKPVHVRVEHDEGQAVLSVADEGIGVAPKDQARIFERFERASSVRSFGGIGLGLWITRQIVEAHKGRIEVTSALGAGSTFTVLLPAAEKA